MKTTEFKKLINECVREVINEEKRKDYILERVKETYSVSQLEEIFGFSKKEREEKAAKKREKAAEMYNQRYKRTEKKAAENNGIDVDTYREAVIDYLVSTDLLPSPAKYDKAKGKFVSTYSPPGVSGITGAMG